MEYLSEMAANLWEKYIYYRQLYIYMEYFTMKYYCQYNYSFFVCSLIIYRMYNIELTSSFFFPLFLSLLRSGAFGVLLRGGKGGLGRFWLRLVFTWPYLFCLTTRFEDFCTASNSLSSVLVPTSSVLFLVA